MSGPERKAYLITQELDETRNLVELAADSVRLSTDLIAILIPLCKRDLAAYTEYTNADGTRDESLLEKVELMTQLIPLLKKEKRELFTYIRETRGRVRWLERERNQAQKNLLKSMSGEKNSDSSK